MNKNDAVAVAIAILDMSNLCSHAFTSEPNKPFFIDWMGQQLLYGSNQL